MMLRIKFCGGCNPRYDRALFLARMRQHFPQFEVTYEDIPAEAAVLICGCRTACLRNQAVTGCQEQFIVSDSSDWEGLMNFLQAAAVLKHRS